MNSWIGPTRTLRPTLGRPSRPDVICVGLLKRTRSEIAEEANGPYKLDPG